MNLFVKCHLNLHIDITLHYITRTPTQQCIQQYTHAPDIHLDTHTDTYTHTDTHTAVHTAVHPLSLIHI